MSHSKSPYELLDPAINSTKAILASIQRSAPTVKRVVITSSFAAIVSMADGPRPGYVYSEKDWNPMTWEQATSGDANYAYYG